MPGNTSARIKPIAKILLGYERKCQKIFETYTTVISQYQIERSGYICNHGNWQGQLEYAPREQYGNDVMGLDVRVPELYDAYLTQKYEDWRSDLPLEKQKGHHYYKVLDLDMSYTNCL